MVHVHTTKYFHENKTGRAEPIDKNIYVQIKLKDETIISSEVTLKIENMKCKVQRTYINHVL